MANDVAIGAGMRANLLSLQKTNSLLDATQFKLSTGRKINSALDNPQSFFAAQALTNRAGDLGRLLDSMGQSIQTIKQSDNAVTSMTKLVEQADAIGKQAQDELASASQEAKVVGSRDLRGLKDLKDDLGVAANSTVTVTVTKPDGSGNVFSTAVTISDAESIETFVAEINALDDAEADPVIEAKLNDSGQLEVKALNGGNLRLVFEDVAVGTADDAADKHVAEALGFGSVAKTTASGAALADPNETAVTVAGTAALTSHAFYDNAEIATRSTILTDLESSSGTAYFTRAADGGAITLGVNGGAAVNIVSSFTATTTLQDLIDGINTSTLKGKVEATYSEDTGELTIRAIDASVTNIQIGVTDDADSAVTANFGFGTSVLNPTVASGSMVENIQLGASAGALAKLEKDYDAIRDQIDKLVEDSGYRGTNLLNGDSLETVFNEDRTTSLVTKGSVLTSAGLGLSAANFSSATAVSGTLTELAEGLATVRGFGQTLANDLSIIQSREDFTKQTINTLNEGADKLTLADQNEEGAKMLALQTRLQLGVTSLSLAAQSQQSVLSLF